MCNVYYTSILYYQTCDVIGLLKNKFRTTISETVCMCIKTYLLLRLLTFFETYNVHRVQYDHIV